MQYFSRFARIAGLMLLSGAALLPAYAVAQEKPEETTLYVNIIHGTVDCRHIPLSERDEVIERNLERIKRRFDERIKYLIKRYFDGYVDYTITAAAENEESKTLKDMPIVDKTLQNELCQMTI